LAAVDAAAVDATAVDAAAVGCASFVAGSAPSPGLVAVDGVVAAAFLVAVVFSAAAREARPRTVTRGTVIRGMRGISGLPGMRES
jgi:hypothetical protein